MVVPMSSAVITQRLSRKAPSPVSTEDNMPRVHSLKDLPGNSEVLPGLPPLKETSCLIAWSLYILVTWLPQTLPSNLVPCH